MAASRNTLTRADLLFSVLLLVAFFLPWFGQESGFHWLRAMLQTREAATEAQGLGWSNWFLYALIAIPAGAVVVILFALVRLPTGLFALVAGAAPWVIAASLYIEAADQPIGRQVLGALGYGAFATLIVGLLLLLAGIGVFRSGRS